MTDRTPSTAAAQEWLGEWWPEGNPARPPVTRRLLAIEAEARREGWDAALAAVRLETGPDHDGWGLGPLLDRLASEGPR